MFKRNKLVLSLLIILTLNMAKIPSVSGESGKLLFGLGPEANDAINQPLVQKSNIKMLSSWYNGTKDLSWMKDWKTSTVPQSYAKGFAMHLIIFSDDEEKSIQTDRGDACGRDYPLSTRYLKDMEELSKIFKGNGPLYVTVFTEFQTYPCKDNQWKGNENYFNALKEQYTKTQLIFKTNNINAKVSLGWGGWQARYDDKTNGGGRSLFPYFEDVMRSSDFQSFQSMQSDHNTQDIKDMTNVLSKYGPVMLAHYKPDNRSQETFDRDINAMFRDDYFKEVVNSGLFAISFMDHYNLSKSEQTLDAVVKGVNKYAKSVNFSPNTVAVSTKKPLTTQVKTASPSATPQSTPVPSLIPIPTSTAIPTFISDNYLIEEKESFLSKLTEIIQTLFK